MNHRITLVGAALAAVAAVASAGTPAKTAPVPPPPWEPSLQQGRRFTVPQVDNAPDLHGDVVAPDLVVFYGGNQFMVVPELIEAFRRARPEVRRIFVETLPPGVLADQLEQGALVMGNLRIELPPDVFIAGRSRIERMQHEGRVEAPRPINRSRLALMVPAGNPKRIRSMADLARPGVRVAMPNPAWEGIAAQIEASLRAAGGDALVSRVMRDKRAAGSVLLTDIHHRQTPMWLMAGASDAGPVWETEARYQQRLGHPLETVALPEPEQRTGTTLAAVVRGAPHAEAARAFVDFLAGPEAQAIYRRHGFLAP